MCISPNFVWIERGPKWEQQPVACRQCWRCKENRVNDYVGRALAEASTSQMSCTLSMTYAPRDDLADKVVTPRHFQLFMKRLRRAGHKVRYLVAGEYGELKDRAHFHAILFFEKIANWDSPRAFYNRNHVADPESSACFSPHIPSKRMVHIREWPHGHIKCDWSSTEKSARYVCKYLLSDDKNSAWFSLSKKPALGAAWFAQKSETVKGFGLLPSSFEYLPPGGSPNRSYLMTGATRRDYLNNITTDRALRGRMSEWVQKTFDKQERQRWLQEIDNLPPAVVLQAMTERFSDASERQSRINAASDRRSLWSNYFASLGISRWVFVGTGPQMRGYTEHDKEFQAALQRPDAYSFTVGAD